MREADVVYIGLSPSLSFLYYFWPRRPPSRSLWTSEKEFRSHGSSAADFRKRMKSIRSFALVEADDWENIATIKASSTTTEALICRDYLSNLPLKT